MSNQSGSAFWTCPQCGGMGSIYDTQCPQCGVPRASINQPASLNPLVKQLSAVSSGVQRLTSQSCPQCGTANSLFVLRCQGCGTLLTSVRPSTTTRRRGVAALLAFFGGIIGAQYFYMGRRVLGVACVALCWTGYPLLVGALDAFRLMTMSDGEFQQQCEG